MGNTENKIKLEVDLKAMCRVIFGENNRSLDYKNINVWKDNARKELRSVLNDIEIEDLKENVLIKKRDVFNFELLWQVLDFLDNIEFVNNGNYFVIDDKMIDTNMIERIFNIYAINNFKNYDTIIDDTEKKQKRIKNFISEIQNETIIVKIFDNARDMINYVFIEGQDDEQILDSFMKVIENNNLKLDEFNVYPNVYKLENKYVYILN